MNFCISALMMNNEDIVSDIISLIHSSTQSNYVLCSEISSKIFSYLSKIPFRENQWNELNEAIEKFNQSLNHPDLELFRKLIQIISDCSHDDEERNYTLGRDKKKLIDSIYRLQELLKSHVDLRCFLLTKVIEQQDIRLQLIDLMNLTGMNLDDEIHGILFDIIHRLCQLDPTFLTSNVIDHSIVFNCIRIIENKSPSPSIISALILLADLVLSNGSFPIQTNNQLSNEEFLKSIFQLIENNSEIDEIIIPSLKFLLAFNLRYDYPNENPLILTLIDINQEVSSRKLIENLILLFNRNIDPIENSTNHSIIKFFADLFSDYGDVFFSNSNRQLIIEILSRELTNHFPSESITTSYLSLLELILRTQMITSKTCTRINELQSCFQSYLSSENCLDDNRFILNEILRQHSWLRIE